MIISYNWLKKYIPNMPDPETVAEGIIFHAFEVENVERKNDDYILDIKVLPDRSHDCLCHRGIAREVGAIFNLPISVPVSTPTKQVETSRDLSVTIDDSKLCRRYIGRLIEGVTVGESPDWLAGSLRVLDQRPINSVVDAANYVMFDVGQPLHAFDADKVRGGIIVRLAKAGERIVTLDNQDVDLDAETLIIADDEGPLAIAGIKGGRRAEVTADTKNIILESANFNPVAVRKTSARLGIRTDASKRFENELSTEVAGLAMDEFTDLVLKLSGGGDTKVGPKIDEYRSRNLPPQIVCTVTEINKILGLEISQAEMINILERLGMTVEIEGEEMSITPPPERIDVDIKEAIVEEVGRIWGYEKIAPLPVGEFPDRPVKSLTERHYDLGNKIREVLVTKSFSELSTYPIVSRGELVLANPLAEDKGRLRADLLTANLDRLNFNLQHVLFDTELVKIFELGHVFKKSGEESHLVIGVGSRMKKFSAHDEITGILNDLSSVLGVKMEDFVVERREASGIKGEGVEINLNKLAEKITDFSRPNLDPFIASDKQVYKPVSVYPRMVRDVAVWVPSDITTQQVGWTIKESAGPLLDIGPTLFDTYEKDGRKSLAFRLVLQSYERTLSDEEAGAVMSGVIDALEQNEGWEVRK